VLAAWAVVALAGVAGARAPAPPPKADVRDDFRFLPEDSQFILVVRHGRLLDSAAYQLAIKEMPESAEWEKAAALWGVPPSDVEWMTAGGDAKDGVALYRTKKAVKAEDIQAVMKKAYPKTEFDKSDVGRYTIYELKGADAGGPPAFCVADERQVIFGKLDTLRAVLKRDKAPEFSAKLQAAMKQADFDATVAVAAGGFPKGALGGPGAIGPTDFNKMFDKVDGVTLALRVGADVDASVVLLCQDEKAAADLKETVKKAADAYKSLLTLAGKDVPAEVTDLTDIDPQVSGANVTVKKTAKVAPIIKWAKEQQKKGQGPGKPPEGPQ
jgi:hypothetical protein